MLVGGGSGPASKPAASSSSSAGHTSSAPHTSAAKAAPAPAPAAHAYAGSDMLHVGEEEPPSSEASGHTKAIASALGLHGGSSASPLSTVKHDVSAIQGDQASLADDSHQANQIRQGYANGTASLAEHLFPGTENGADIPIRGSQIAALAAHGKQVEQSQLASINQQEASTQRSMQGTSNSLGTFMSQHNSEVTAALDKLPLSQRAQQMTGLNNALQTGGGQAALDFLKHTADQAGSFQRGSKPQNYGQLVGQTLATRDQTKVGSAPTGVQARFGGPNVVPAQWSGTDDQANFLASTASMRAAGSQGFNHLWDAAAADNINNSSGSLPGSQGPATAANVNQFLNKMAGQSQPTGADPLTTPGGSTVRSGVSMGMAATTKALDDANMPTALKRGLAIASFGLGGANNASGMYGAMGGGDYLKTALKPSNPSATHAFVVDSQGNTTNPADYLSTLTKAENVGKAFDGALGGLAVGVSAYQAINDFRDGNYADGAASVASGAGAGIMTATAITDAAADLTPVGWALTIGSAAWFGGELAYQNMQNDQQIHNYEVQQFGKPTFAGI